MDAAAPKARPDESLFSKNERPGEYEARFSVRGEISITIKADSLEEAKEKAALMAQDEGFGCELDAADEVDVSYVWKSPVMYRVLRDGEAMQVSRIQEGDEPREPDERHGF